MTANPLPEADVLAPLDPSTATTSDEWPEFELTNARVYAPEDRTATTSLLLATEHHPLTVTGDVQLHAIPKDLSYLIRQQNHGRTASIEIADVKAFAYGQFDDGNIALWAAGRAGWFALKPARPYRAMYNEMGEAVKLLYFIADAYREERKSGKGKNSTVLPPDTVQELFEMYATEVMAVPKAASEAAEKIYAHVDFLFASMLAGKEGIDWVKNPLYVHLRKKCSAEHDVVLQRLAGPTVTSKKGSQARRVRQDSVDTSSTSSSLKRKRGRPPKSKEADVISLGSSSAATSTAKEVQKPSVEPSKSMAPPQGRPAAGRRTRRKPSPPVVDEPEPTATPIPEISDSEEEAERQVHQGKSALRLKPSQAAKGSKGAKGGKGAKRSGKAPAIEDDDDEEDELASSPTISKRRFEEPPAPPHRRRRSSKQEVDEGIDMPESPSASEPNEPGTPDVIAGATEGGPISHELATRLKHVPDPVQEDTWVCALDGCTHKVYLASQLESQRLIREHYALHAYDDDDRVKMIKKFQAPSLPVNHLMEKVRLQARLEGFPGSRVAGTRYPEPIAQRY